MKAGDDTMDGSRSALIVASDDYTDPGLRRLRAPASDAQALAGVLRDPAIGGFQVRTLLNQPAHEVNLAVEEFFADRRPDDLLLLHFSCHGVKDEGGELYFAAANTKLRRLGATAVAAEFVNRRMSRSRSRRVVLLLDCCYAGAFERGMTARAGTGIAIEEQFGGRGRAVITASSAMEYAFEGDELADTQALAPSVFTSALVEGLETGEADRDQDGLVALDELYDYVFDKVQAATPNQTPGKWTFGVQGDLYIARRSRPVATPAPLPPELQQAIDHPLAAVRAGAVQELARLFGSRHAGLALAGRLALERLTQDDSRAVCAAATAALGAQAQPAVSQPAPPQPVPPQPVPPRLDPTPAPKPPTAAVRQPPAAGQTTADRVQEPASWPPPPEHVTRGRPRPRKDGSPELGGHLRGDYRGDRLATWPQRVGAALIDELAFIPGMILFWAGVANNTFPVVLLGLVALAINAYNRWHLQGTTGQSWGKRALHLRLVRMTDKQPIGFGAAFLRGLAHTLDILTAGVGYLFPLWDVRRQTLADKVMKTVVISTRDRLQRPANVVDRPSAQGSGDSRQAS